jgi:hypothetical protein
MEPSPIFTPLESPAIDDGGVERKCLFLIEDRVKATSFLTGFITRRDTETQDMDDPHKNLHRSNESQYDKSISTPKG